MRGTRRHLLFMCLTVAGAFLLRSKTVLAQNPVPPRRDPGTPDDPENSPNAPRVTKAILEQHQKDIKKDVDRLYDLAKELKTEVEKTDATAVLSLAMVKKAEEIEKLAKQIKDHAKG
jgi:hypothetical protein